MKNIKVLNKTSYPTWKHLKVNSTSIEDFSLPTVGTYNMESIEHDELKLINLLDSKDNIAEFKDYINYNKDFGVSKEVVDYTEKNYNSGWIIVAEVNKIASKPVKLLYNLDGENNILVDNNIIVAKENSSLTVVIDYSTVSGGRAFHSGVTKVFASKGSKVKVIKVQRLNDISIHLDSNIGIVDQNAEVEWINIEIGSEINITNYISYLENYKSTSELYSGYFLDGERKQDIYHTMIHKGKKSNSVMNVKGVVKDSPHKLYKGVVDFKKGSKESKGEQMEYVTLLNRGVKVDSVPMLLCEEDDVQGAHAASLGQINDNMLFYLMSRGLSDRDAKLLLVKGTFNSILDRIADESLVSNINEELERRLKAYED